MNIRERIVLLAAMGMILLAIGFLVAGSREVATSAPVIQAAQPLSELSIPRLDRPVRFMPFVVE